LRVSRSLTIKQMAMVASVSMAFVLVFCTILLFHFVQQSRFTTATQLESIARSVREPLSAAILKADIPEAEAILSRIQPAGIVSRADVVAVLISTVENLLDALQEGKQVDFGELGKFPSGRCR
jgi:hypothetical protein